MNIEKDDTCTGLDVNCVDEKKSGSKEPKIYELDKIITIQAIGGEVKIAKVFLDDFTIFFREYFDSTELTILWLYSITQIMFTTRVDF